MRKLRPRHGLRRDRWRSVLLPAILVASWAPLLAPRGASPQDARFEHLTNRDGLSQMSVSAIAQDQQDFMWFGTSNGLNRYNGYDFKIFEHQPHDLATLSADGIRTLHESPSGMMWIGTRSGGLNRFNPVTGRFDHFRHDPADPLSLSHDNVTAITEDSFATLWVGTEGGGLNRLPDLSLSPQASPQFTHFQHDPATPGSLSHDHVSSILAAPEGSLWIGTQGGGLNRYDPVSEQFTHYRHQPQDPRSLGHDLVSALAQDGAGGLWIGTSGGGLDRFDPNRGEFTHYRHTTQDPSSLSSDMVVDLHVDQQGSLWIATWGGGLNRLNPPYDRFTHYRHDPRDAGSLSTDTIVSFAEDRAGSLWIGTSLGGINRFDPAQEYFAHYWHQPEDPKSLSHDNVRSIHRGPSGVLWIGTGEGGLNQFHPATETTSAHFTHYQNDPRDPDSLSHNSVRSILEDRRGRLWVGTWRGLNRLEASAPSGELQSGEPPARARFTHFQHDPANPHSLSHDKVLAITEDHDGRLWFGTSGGGLNYLDPQSTQFFHYQHDAEDPHSLSHDNVWGILEDRSQRLWIATYGGGLNQLDPASGQFTRYRYDPNDPQTLSHDLVLCLAEDHDGTLWVGTAGGLNRFDSTSGQFDHFTRRDGLPNNFVYGILEDGQDRLWISTNRGLARFDPKTNHWAQYDAGHGLQDAEFNGGAFAKAADGTLYFGGIHGFNAFHPERFQGNPHRPAVVLTSFKIFEKEVISGPSFSFLDSIELTSQENFFSFEFAALNFIRPDKNRYAYQLEGFDEGWVDAGTRRYAVYTGVPPGEYTLRVRGSNNDGLWKEEGTSISLVVLPPLWKSWWAYSIYSMVLLGALTSYRRWQMRVAEHERQIQMRKEELIAELQASNQELARFNYTVSHDLRNPLVTIKNFVGMVRRDASQGRFQNLERDFDRIEGAASKMQRLLDELLELSRVGRVINPPQKVYVEEIAREAVELLSAAIETCGVQVVIAPDLPVVQGDRTRLLQVMQNLIENAVKFLGEQPQPRIDIGASPQAIFVRDNGIGIKPEFHQKIFRLFDRLNPESDGTGVGLALVQRIIETHGGRVWVESEGTGKGSTFLFTLPSLLSPDPGGVKKTAPGH